MLFGYPGWAWVVGVAARDQMEEGHTIKFLSEMIFWYVNENGILSTSLSLCYTWVSKMDKNETNSNK